MNEPDAPDPHIGLVIDGRFEIQTLLGEGGMGSVYLGQQRPIGRPVAIKILKPELASDPSALARFRGEAETIGKLRDPATVKLIEFGQHPAFHYLVMEFIAGRPLSSVLAAGPMSAGRTLGLLRQVADSLAEAHERDIIHRDIKPGNLMLEMVTGRELVKVVDFGIARLIADLKLTRTGTIVGTPTYLSPEQASEQTVTAQSDIYSLGVVAYECVTGRVPFTATTLVGLLLKHAAEPPPPLPADVPPALAALITRMLAKDPLARPIGARALRSEIEALLATVDPSAKHESFTAGDTRIAATRLRIEPTAKMSASGFMTGAHVAPMADTLFEPRPREVIEPARVKRAPMAAVLAVGLAAIAGGWAMSREGDAPKSAAQASAPAPPPSAPALALPSPTPEAQPTVVARPTVSPPAPQKLRKEKPRPEASPSEPAADPSHNLESGLMP